MAANSIVIFEALGNEHEELAEQIDHALGSASDHVKQLVAALQGRRLTVARGDLSTEQHIALDNVRRDMLLFVIAAFHVGFNQMYGVFEEDVDFSAIDDETFNILIEMVLGGTGFKLEVVELAKQLMRKAYPRQPEAV